MAGSGTPTSHHQLKPDDNMRFISIRVKPQPYFGKSRVALFINDRTKKVQDKLRSMREQESFLDAQQAEGYTATISHEMHSPLESLVWFVDKIARALLAITAPNASMIQAQSYCNLV